MNQKVLATLTKIMDNDKLSQEFLKLENMEDMYDYCQKIESGYSEKEFDETSTIMPGWLMVQAGWLQDVEFTATTSGGYSNWYDRIAGGASADWHLDDSNSLGLEFQWLQEEDKTRGRNDWFQYYACSMSRAPWLSLTIGAEFTEKPSESGGLKSSVGLIGGSGKYWPSADVTLDMLDRHKVNLFFGYERGGLRCSGGSCRQVNPFKGAKVTWTTML